MVRDWKGASGQRRGWRRAWKGVYEERKWWSLAVVRLLTGQGFSEPLRYRRVCLDTGSPHIILPGRCPSPPSDADSLPDIVHVEVAVDSAEHSTGLNLPPRGRVIGFGGVGGVKRDRYLFCAEVAVEGLDYNDLVNVVIFDPSEVAHPIVGLSEVVESGRSITFSSKGFRMG